MLITCTVSQQMFVLSFHHTIHITEKQFFLSCRHFYQVRQLFCNVKATSHRFSLSACSSARNFTTCKQKGLTSIWYISTTMAPTLCLWVPSNSTVYLTFSMLGELPLCICVYSPRLRHSAANSLRLESETFCSNANIYHISRLIWPHFLPEKMPLSITPRLSTRRTNCSTSANNGLMIIQCICSLWASHEVGSAVYFIKTFLACSQWKAAKLCLTSPSSLRPRWHFYEIWHWKVLLKLITKLALVTYLLHGAESFLSS